MDFVFAAALPPAPPLRAAIRDSCRIDETVAVERILSAADLPSAARDRIAETARQLVVAVRRDRLGKGGIDAFLHEYALSSQEGVALLCLAEALLRIPDAETVDRLIRDKLGEADWARHLGHSDSLFVNASTWALMLTGRLLHTPARRARFAHRAAPLHRPLGRAGGAPGGDRGDAHPRPPVRHGPHHRGGARTRAAGRAPGLSPFLRHAGRGGAHRGRCGALSRRLYRRDRRDRPSAAGRPVVEAPGISVKLSALHPRYEMAQRERVLAELGPALYWRWPAARARPASALPSTPRRPTASTCRSIWSRDWRLPPSLPAGTGSASPSRPIRSAPCR